MRKSTKKVLAFALSAAMTLGLTAVVPSGDTKIDNSTGTVAKAATGSSVKTYSYHAYLNFQTDSNWLFRGEWYGTTTTNPGRNVKKFKYTTSAEKDKTVDFDYSKHYCKSGAGAGKYSEGGVFPANFTDVTIDHNGTYTVKMEGVDLSPAGEGLPAKTKDGLEVKEDRFNMLSVLTDISKKVPNAKFSNVALEIDGSKFCNDVGVWPKIDSTDGNGNTFYNLMVVNVYGTKAQGDLPRWTSNNGKVSLKNTTTATDDQKKLASSYMPKKSIAITFTVSGIDFTKDPSLYLNKKKTDDKSSSGTVGLAKGKTFTKSGLKYKVTTIAKSGKAGKVSVVGVSSKKKKSYSIPKTAKYNSKASYTVTAIAANAFKNCKKATKITIGAKVTSIAKNAFKGCAKLSKLKISSKLSTVKKGAFSGVKKTIKVSGKNVKANIKKLKKSGYKKFK